MCALAGFDYVLLDVEHGWVCRDLPHLIVTAQAFGIPPVFRIPANDRGWILPALEAGVGGIWAPMVRHEQEARAIIEQLKYVPLGSRGLSLATRAARYGACSREEHIAIANRETLAIITLETAEALNHATEIASIP